LQIVKSEKQVRIMAQGYPHLVYGIRSVGPLAGIEDIEVENYEMNARAAGLAEGLGLPAGLSVQLPDEEQGYEFTDIHPVIYVTESEVDPYSTDHWKGAVVAGDIKPEWNDLLTAAQEKLGIEKEARWHAFVLTY
jgi:hypothetical protein